MIKKLKIRYKKTFFYIVLGKLKNKPLKVLFIKDTQRVLSSLKKRRKSWMFLTSSALFMTTWFDAVGTKLSFVIKTDGLSFLRLRLTVFFFADVSKLFG